jgi:hypothetical protein
MTLLFTAAGLIYFTALVLRENLNQRAREAADAAEQVGHATRCYPHPNESPQRWQLTAQELFNLRHNRP